MAWVDLHRELLEDIAAVQDMQPGRFGSLEEALDIRILHAHKQRWRRYYEANREDYLRNKRDKWAACKRKRVSWRSGWRVTGRERDLLVAIASSQRLAGAAPTMAELGMALGVSRMRAYQLFNSLAKLGYVERRKGAHRAISLRESAWSMILKEAA